MKKLIRSILLMVSLALSPVVLAALDSVSFIDDTEIWFGSEKSLENEKNYLQADENLRPHLSICRCTRASPNLCATPVTVTQTSILYAQQGFKQVQANNQGILLKSNTMSAVTNSASGIGPFTIETSGAGGFKVPVTGEYSVSWALNITNSAGYSVDTYLFDSSDSSLPVGDVISYPLSGTNQLATQTQTITLTEGIIYNLIVLSSTPINLGTSSNSTNIPFFFSASLEEES